MMMMNGRNVNRCGFTSYQWEELEQQALIFKYILSGTPIPSHLLSSLKTTTFYSPTLFTHHQPINVGWGSSNYEYWTMANGGGGGRKIDPEPGRCRRTDGKKWRCSKEASPDSKYCERHMHRGRNRSSRTHNNTSNTNTNTPSQPPPPPPPPPPPSSNSSVLSYTTTSSSSQSQTHHRHPLRYNTTSSSSTSLVPSLSTTTTTTTTSPPPLQYSSFSTTTTPFHSSLSYSQQPNQIYTRYLENGMRGDHERSLFPVGQGGSSLHSYTRTNKDTSSSPHHDLYFESLTTTTTTTNTNDHDDDDKYSKKQLMQQQEHCFVMGADFKSIATSSSSRSRSIEEDKTEKPFHHFLGEWQQQQPPQKNPNPTHNWLDNDNDIRHHHHHHHRSISKPLSTRDLLQSNPPTSY